MKSKKTNERAKISNSPDLQSQSSNESGGISPPTFQVPQKILIDKFLR